METLERRALVLLIPLSLSLAFDTPNFFVGGRGRWWEIAAYVIGTLCLAVAAALTGLILTPTTVVAIRVERRERLWFLACVLVAGAIAIFALLRAWETYYFHKHGL